MRWRTWEPDKAVVNRAKHGKDLWNSQSNLACTEDLGAEPQYVRIRGKRKALARWNLREASTDLLKRSRLIQPQRCANGDQPKEDGHS